MPLFKAKSFFVLSLVLLASCNSPIPIASADWCLTQPCLEVFGWTINQISSSILVYVLAFYGLFVGYKYYKNKGLHSSRLYWSISLVLGGLGALAAGTSFQAFGYEIKCAGKEFCDLTSFYEIAYNILTVWSAVFLGLAISASFLLPSKIKILKISSLVFGLSYTLLCLMAYSYNNYFLISFEFLLLYILPLYLGTIILTGIHYAKNKDLATKKYLYAWLILMLTLSAYYLYLSLGFTEILWANGIWFSANDVLHLGMMGWLYYLSNWMMGVVEDFK